MNHLYIRADATVEIGTGHIMRCIALAQAWKKRGGTVTFLSGCTSKPLVQRIKAEGFELCAIEKQWPHPQDVQQTLEILQHAQSSSWDGVNWLVIDGYHFTHGYHRSIREQGFKLLVIDDYHHLDQYDADIILNQNIGADRYNYSCGPATCLLLGPAYAMLRSEFTDNPPMDEKQPARARSILVTLGGADADNLTLTMIRTIQQIDDPGLTTRIAVGPANPHMKSLAHAVQQHPCKIELIEKPDMPRLMAGADMAISAGGSTCWELCFHGVPFLTVSMAENQDAIVSELSALGVAVDLGPQKELTTDIISRAIIALSHDPDKRSRMAQSGSALIDGKGTKRLIRQMLVDQITLRSAKGSDARLLWRWANDTEVRASSFQSAPIPWDTHLQWFRDKLDNSHSWLFIAENRSGIPVGQIRFDLNHDIIEISYSLAREFRRLGLGKELLGAGIGTMQSRIDSPRTIQGKIKQDNMASRTSFEKCGFTLLKPAAEEPISTPPIYQRLLHPKS